MDWLWVLIVAVRALSPAPADQWATQLTALDRARAEAFAQADPSGLDDVYVAGSVAAAADAATIAAYAARGGRVVGAELRILTCRLVQVSGSRVRLEVVDRLGPARVRWQDGTTTDLPRDRPSRRRVTVVRTSEGWRIAGSGPA
ncbi:hypothetical protein [Aeromicrobium wangtongii]|uniref:SnoaL-like domain-containing protein n=1 Tax=Aeromicrobium wangtongii TaxID=2969247 RepID=A0ABY5MDH8_9ACTN|nr:hypothetical protein [Aeromicrobium wangtongii]MCD9197492.1 hypothetical protein [Aeromicrobium wangtongii]UUP14984.1 hypothetical protein NQV15_06645 [Aeromicrobium wangtongii]